jgi:acetyl-CoA carboxylase biotin carboxyl carrier protein
LTAKEVAEIMRLLEESTFDSLVLEMEGLKLSLQRGKAARPEAQAPVPAATSPQARSTNGHEAALAATMPWGEHAVPKVKPPGAPDLIDVPSPLLGTFYHAPKPGEAPYVGVGAKVDETTIIGIIEVMKLMNSVRAGVAGEIVEILAENGAFVEYGETLLRVRANGAQHG